jgi:hypothetical protein
MRTHIRDLHGNPFGDHIMAIEPDNDEGLLPGLYLSEEAPGEVEMKFRKLLFLDELLRGLNTVKSWKQHLKPLFPEFEVWQVRWQMPLVISLINQPCICKMTTTGTALQFHSSRRWHVMPSGQRR